MKLAKSKAEGSSWKRLGKDQGRILEGTEKEMIKRNLQEAGKTMESFKIPEPVPSQL